MKYNTKNGLKIMPEFDSSGIWDTKNYNMIEYKELDLPEDLIEDFKNWIAYYDTCFKRDWTTMKKGKANKLNEMGRNLAQRLKILFPKAKVQYVGEDMHGVLNPVTWE